MTTNKTASAAAVGARLPYLPAHRTLADLDFSERYNLIVADEIGYLPLERQAANLLFELVARRCEQGSIIVTSNRRLRGMG